MKLHSCLAVLLPLLFALSACQNTASETTIIEERDGVTYVMNHGEGLWADREEPPLAFELEQTFGANDGSEAMLASVASIVVDDDGNLYVLDTQDHRIVAFAPDGSLMWAAGREGEGPGEFNMPWGGMIWDEDDGLYISNQMGSRIDHWKADGTFVESLSLEPFELRFARPVTIVEDHLLLETGVQNERAVDLHSIDLERWEADDSHRITISDRALPRENMSITANLKRWEDELVTSQGQGEYTLLSFELDGTPRRVITREVDYLLSTGIHEIGGGGIRVQSYSSLDGPFLLPGGYLLTSSYWATNVRDPDEHLRLSDEGHADEIHFVAALDLFDADGRFLSAMRWDDAQETEIGSLQLSAPDSRLYTTTNDPYPQVRRYRVTVAEER